MGETEDIGEFEQVGIPEHDKPPFVLPPDPSVLFGRRAMRFEVLAKDHKLETYLKFLAALSRLQDELARELPDPPLPPMNALRTRAMNGMPVLPREDLADDPLVAEAVDKLLKQASKIDMPDAARTALERAAAADADLRREMIAAVLSDAIPVETVADHIFIAAALQVVAAKRAAPLPERLAQPVANGVCPCCGGPPVTSAVVSFGDHEGVRYVQCALCAARWNHVRIRCVSCGSTKGIAYHAIEGVADTIKAETCDECRTYVKILYQRKDPELEPVADDVASLGLDILVGEAGWKRAGVNPFLLGY